MSDRDKLIKNKLLSFAISFLGLILIAVNESTNSDGAFLLLGIVLAFGGLVYMAFTYRCPYCGRLLYTRGPTPHYCPHCGEEIF